MNNKAKLSITCLFQCLVCFLQFKSLYSETVLGEETGEFDFFGRPGARHQFEVQVGAGREECFYQTLRKGETLEVSYKECYCPNSLTFPRTMTLEDLQWLLTFVDYLYNKKIRYVFGTFLLGRGSHYICPYGVDKASVQVLGGDNRKVNVFLKNPNLTIIDSITDEPDGDFDMVVTETGDYSICIDNTLRPFSSKLVYFYLATYVTSEWEKYAKELDDIHVAVSNFAASINSVDNSTNEVLKHQAHTKMNWAWDYYQAYRNMNYVQHWAILQCAIFIVTSVFQVYFVRRFFLDTLTLPRQQNQGLKSKVSEQQRG